MEELFQQERWRVVSSSDRTGFARADADVKIRVKGESIHTAAEGVGPVDALYVALRKALNGFYPEINELELVDYLVHIKDSNKGTTAEVKVVLEMRRGNQNCIITKSSVNILEASWNALVEGISNLLSVRRKE